MQKQVSNLKGKTASQKPLPSFSGLFVTWCRFGGQDLLIADCQSPMWAFGCFQAYGQPAPSLKCSQRHIHGVRFKKEISSMSLLLGK